MPHEEQPWMVFAARPAPLANLIGPKSQRSSVLSSLVENEDSGDVQQPVEDVAGHPAS